MYGTKKLLKLENRRKLALTGLIGAIVLISVLVTYSYLRNTPAFNPKKIFYADFKRVSSLKVGAYVYLNGFDVGRVKDIELIIYLAVVIFLQQLFFCFTLRILFVNCELIFGMDFEDIA